MQASSVAGVRPRDRTGRVSLAFPERERSVDASPTSLKERRHAAVPGSTIAVARGPRDPPGSTLRAAACDRFLGGCGRAARDDPPLRRRAAPGRREGHRQFFAAEYTFVNARGERLSRADRLANLRTGRTAVDSVAHAPQEEQFRPYGNAVVYTTLLTLGGQYSGRSQRGQFRALVVWVRRDGRWQQVASQLTPVVAP
jgi:hypothetical protein